MERNKFGVIFGATTSSGWNTTPTTEYAEQYEKNCMDPRSDLKCIQSNTIQDKKETDDANCFFDFLCFTDNAAVIYVCKPIPGRDESYQCGTITIPNNIDLENPENITKILKLINLTKKEISKIEYSRAQFNELFNIEYQVTNKLQICHSSSNNEKYARQVYGKDTEISLQDILKRLFSPCYNHYKAVFLIDNTEHSYSLDESVEELTFNEVEACATLQYPKDCEYTLTINKKEFKEDLTVSKGDEIHIIVSHKDNDYEKEIIAIKVPNDQDIVTINEKLDKIDWKICITKSWFKVFGASTPDTELDSFKVFIEGSSIEQTQISSKTAIPISSLKNAQVCFESQSFNTKKISLETILKERKATNKKVFEVKLEPAAKKYKYIIQHPSGAINSKSISFTIEIVSNPGNISPLDGYDVVKTDDNIFYLEKKQNKISIQVLYILVSALCLLFIGGGFAAGWFLKPSEPSPKVDDITAIFQLLEDEKFADLESQYNELRGNQSYDSVKEKISQATKPGADTSKPSDTEATSTGGGSSTSGQNNLSTSQPDQYAAIKLLLEKTIWNKTEFSNAGYKASLFNKLNTYDYIAIKNVAEKLTEQGVGTDRSVYKTWNKVIAICQEATSVPNTNPFTTGSNIDLNNWMETVILAQILKEKDHVQAQQSQQSNVWNRKNFIKYNKEDIFIALQQYDFNELNRYIQHFDTYTQEQIQKAMNKQVQPDPFSENEINEYQWRQRINNAIEAPTGGMSGYE